MNNTPQDQRAALLRAEEFSWVSLRLIFKSAIFSTECLQPVGTGLHKAAYKGHSPIVSYLIEMGAEVDVQCSKVDPVGRLLIKVVEGVEAFERVLAELHLVTMADCLTVCSQDSCLIWR
jgi:hypothetical protein